MGARRLGAHARADPGTGATMGAILRSPLLRGTGRCSLMPHAQSWTAQNCTGCRAQQGWHRVCQLGGCWRWLWCADQLLSSPCEVGHGGAAAVIQHLRCWLAATCAAEPPPGPEDSAGLSQWCQTRAALRMQKKGSSPQRCGSCHHGQTRAESCLLSQITRTCYQRLVKGDGTPHQREEPNAVGSAGL